MPNAANESSRVRHAPDAAWRLIDGQAVIISSGSRRMRVLNEVGSRIWELSDGRTLGEIVDVIDQEFEAGRDQLMADARAFVDDLAEREMLQVESA